MKRLLLSVTGILAVLLMFPALTFADSSQTVIAGTITKNGSPVSGASVTVTCDSNVLTTTSTAIGTYGVTYTPASLCPAGATAHVTADSGGSSGSNSGKVYSEDDTLNVALVNVSILPELGALTGIGAAVLGGGAFMIARRRQSSDHQA